MTIEDLIYELNKLPADWQVSATGFLLLRDHEGKILKGIPPKPLPTNAGKKYKVRR
jgi:hypothetical protein